MFNRFKRDRHETHEPCAKCGLLNIPREVARAARERHIELYLASGVPVSTDCVRCEARDD